MKSSAKYIFTLLLMAVCFATPSCKKSSSVTTGTQDIYTCYISQHLTKDGLAAKLVGTWNWTSRTCEVVGTTAADKIITVSFASDGTYVLSLNKTLLATGDWKLKLVDGEFYGLDIINMSEYLSGRIVVCGDQLLFNDSYRDGCDHSFERIN